MSADTPFGRATEQLLDFLRDGVRDTDVAVGPPRQDMTDAAIDVFLLGCDGGPLVRHRAHRQQSVTLEYVVAVTGPPELVADRLHEAWTTLSDSGAFEVGQGGVPADLWAAFGVPPRPAVRVQARVTLEQHLPLLPPVTERPVVRLGVRTAPDDDADDIRDGARPEERSRR